MPGNAGVLTVMPNDDGLEGFVTVTVAATDADGLSAEASFKVEVPPAPRPFAPAESSAPRPTGALHSKSLKGGDPVQGVDMAA